MGIERREVVISSERTQTKEFVSIADVHTGEVIDQFWRERRAKPSGRPPDGRTPEFFRVYRTNWVDLVRKRRVTFNEIGVLMSLLAFVGWESCFLVHPKTGENLSEVELAELLGVDRKRLRESIQDLNRKGLVAIVKRGEGRSNHYLLNSHVVFFGKYMKDLSEHAAFAKVEYQPVVPIVYKEAVQKA